MNTSAKLVRSRPGEPDKEWLLERPRVVVGHASTCDIILRDTTVEPWHARLDRTAQGWTLVDLGSPGGTDVNGVSIRRADIQPGDIITLGEARLRFSTDPPRGLEPMAAPIESEHDLENVLAKTRLPATVQDTSAPRLVVNTTAATWQVPLDKELVTIGHHPSNDIVLEDAAVSRYHAHVEHDGETFILRDLHSDAGTWLRDQRVEKNVLQDGDSISIGDARLVFKHGFELQDLALSDAPRRDGKKTRRPVVFVPGFFGSELWRGSDRIWPNVRMMVTHPEIYERLDDRAIEARDLVQEVVIIPNLIKHEQYQRLGNYLEEGLGYERGKDLLEVPYDWRQDIRISARRLAEHIEQWQARSMEAAQPITLIAHSMGCMVSRYYVERLGGKYKVERLILLGGPHEGTLSALTNLLMARILPFGLMGERLREVLAHFPSIYQILPTAKRIADEDGRPIDIFEDHSWLADARRPFLRNAREFMRDLGTGSSVPTISIFGYGLQTVSSARVHRDQQGGWREVDFKVLPDGDVTIPQGSAVLKGSEIHPVQQAHGSLYTDNDVKMRLKLELTRGLAL